MVPSESIIAARKLQQQELLTYAEQQRRAELACPGARCVEPHQALAAAILALLHRLSAWAPLALRERPATGPVATVADAPSIAPGA